MALYKRAELCKKLGVSQAYLKSYISREQLILDENNLIDAENPINKLFISSRLKKEEPITEPTTQQTLEPYSQKKSTDKKALFDPETASLQFQDDYMTKKLNNYFKMNKLKEERDLARLKKEKIQGSTIPVEMIKSLIVNLTESARLAWVDASENFTTTISAEAKLSREQSAKIKGELILIVNKALDQAAEISKKNLRRIQNEYSENKGRGEHE